MIKLDATRWFSLLYWGRDHSCTSPGRTAALLCKVVHELFGDPEGPREKPKRGNRRGFGWGREFVYSAPLNQRAKSSKALWAWGNDRGAVSVSEAFRHLVDLVIEAYPDLPTPHIVEAGEVSRPECFLRLIELVKSPSIKIGGEANEAHPGHGVKLPWAKVLEVNEGD